MNLKNKIVAIAIILIASNSLIAQNDPYNPKPGMDKLRNENESGKAIKKMNFLVFGDAKHSPRLADVLKSADGLNPQFCLTTADLVNKGAGEQGVKEYKQLDGEAGWFFRKYPTWPKVNIASKRPPKQSLHNHSSEGFL